jgi:hypothetical protein
VRTGRVGGDRYQEFRTAPHIYASAVHLLGIKLPDASDDATPATRTLDMLLIHVDRFADRDGALVDHELLVASLRNRLATAYFMTRPSTIPVQDVVDGIQPLPAA